MPKAIEILMCAQVNFDNLIELNPAIGKHPMYIMARRQLDDGVEELKKNK